MTEERVTLDWDAIRSTDTVETMLAAARPGLEAWANRGWDLRLRTADGDLGSLPAWLSKDPVHMERGPASSHVLQTEGAVVEAGAIVGRGSRVWRFAHVRAGAVVGELCSVGQGVYVDAGAVIGYGCKLQNGVNVYRGIVLGDGVFVGPSATFTNDLRPRAEGDWEITATLIGRGASIGANATVVCGNHIGAHAMVGAGAVVTRPVPAHALVVGVPARVIGYVCACGRRAPTAAGERWECENCGAEINRAMWMA